MLLARYKRHPGRPIVHLSDFIGHAQLRLKPEARQIVQPYWDKLVSRDGSWAWKHCRSVANYLKGRPGTPRLKQWMRFGGLTGFDLDSLEPHVESIRLSDGPHIRMLGNPRLPLNLATPAGARLIGYYFDSNSRNGAFSNKDPALHKDFRNAVRKVFGNLSISETIMKRGGFGKGYYIRTNVGYAVRTAMSVAGFDCARDQTQANNPLPSWMFNQPSPVKSECLSAAWDAEGAVQYHDVKLRQAAPTTLSRVDGIPHWPGSKAFKQLTSENQTCVLESPPLLLVSAALLLRSMGIVSRLEPTGTTLSSDGYIAYWLLRVQRNERIQAFHSQITLHSPHKQRNLESYVRRSSSPS